MGAKVVALPREMTVIEAVETFLARNMPTTTRRSYAQTIQRLGRAHGELPLSTLDGATLDAFTSGAWQRCAPATWNRHVATLRSFTAHARRRGWIPDDPAALLERRKEPDDRTKAIAESSLERLFRRTDVAIREKCLWRLLYETARAEEVLSADVADLDLENKRLRVRRKGGDANWLHFPVGLGPAAPTTDRRSLERPNLSGRAAPRPRAHASRRRSVPRDRSWAPVLRACRVSVQAGLAQSG